jgi:hypothetical protein
LENTVIVSGQYDVSAQKDKGKVMDAQNLTVEDKE